MMKSKRKMSSIGIMGGTFDPVHVGHLVVAEEAHSKFNLDEVVFIPSGTPPHKKDYTVTPPEDRYLMTVLATAANPHFSVSRMEIDRPGPTYTVDTLKAFKKTYGENTALYFITGLDAILEILTWKDSEKLPRLCYFIAATRPGYDAKDIKKKLNAYTDILARVKTLEVPALSISSSDIRRRICGNMPIKYLLPEAVENYIHKNRLYRNCGNGSGNKKIKTEKKPCQNQK